MGTTITTINTQIPIPMMIRILMSFHLVVSIIFRYGMLNSVLLPYGRVDWDGMVA
jgi:hypothetical protein